MKMSSPQVLTADQPVVSPTKPTPYRLASLTRIFFARLFDLVISAIPGVIFRTLITINPGDWGLMIGTLFVSLGFILFYFVFCPWCFQGNTFGKLLFQIRLKQKGCKRVKGWALFLREAYFMLLPWLVSVIFQIIAIVLMAPYAQSHQQGWAPAAKTAILLTQLGYVFYVVWLIFVGVTIKVQDRHQAVVDLKFNLYVVEKEPFQAEKSQVKKTGQTLKRGDAHVSLTDQPGSFAPDQLEELELEVEVKPQNFSSAKNFETENQEVTNE